MGIANKKLLYVKIKYRMSTGEPSATMFQFPSMMRWSLCSQENKLLENLVCFKHLLMADQDIMMISIAMGESQEQVDVHNDPSQQYDSDTLLDSNGPGSGSSKGKPKDY
jgi:hypothetical protein